jgi:hypothetical protein
MDDGRLGKIKKKKKQTNLKDTAEYEDPRQDGKISSFEDRTGQTA